MVHYGPWPVEPGCRLGGQDNPAHQEPESLRRLLGELQLGERQGVAVSPQGGAHVARREKSRYTTGHGLSGPAADLEAVEQDLAHPRPKTSA